LWPVIKTRHISSSINAKLRLNFRPFNSVYSFALGDEARFMMNLGTVQLSHFELD
jgi:hypothetical protein